MWCFGCRVEGCIGLGLTMFGVEDALIGGL